MMAGASAIDASRRALTGSGADIANLNTTGYQGSRTLFKDTLYSTMQPASKPSDNLGGRNAIQFGSGTALAATDLDTTAGNSLMTGRKGDVAITGDGYLMISDGSTVSYTRDGAFDLDGSNRLVHKSTGMLMVGWSADKNTGEIDTTGPVSPTSYIVVPKGADSAAQQTTKVQLSGNLRNSGADAPFVARHREADGAEGAIVEADGTRFITSANVNNAVGSTIELEFEFRKVAVTDEDFVQGAGEDNTTSKWDWVARLKDTGEVVGGTVAGQELNKDGVMVDAVPAEFRNGNNILEFDGKGRLKNAAALGNIKIPGLPPVEGQPTPNNVPFDVKIDFSTMGSTDDKPNIYMLAQNGNAAELLQDYSIDQSGTITGIYGSQRKALGQMAMAAFTNPAGMERLGNNLLQRSGNSGAPQVGAPGTGSRSKLVPGALEQSNVDATRAIINMNMYSRAAQYGMLAVRTGGEVEDRLINTMM